MLLQGINYQVVFKRYPGKRPRVLLKDKCFEVYINGEIEADNISEAIEEVFRCWFDKRAEVVLIEKLKHYSQIIGVKYNRFCIKAQKTRWGSCSSKGNLNFNWRLIMAPEWVLDYVIVHELSHLKHMNHSKEFWSTVALYIPDYKRAVLWLKENGSSLKLQYSKEGEC